MRLASRFGRTNSIRQERPLTNDELIQVVPSIFSEEKHNSRSERYTYDLDPPSPNSFCILS